MMHAVIVIVHAGVGCLWERVFSGPLPIFQRLKNIILVFEILVMMVAVHQNE